MVLGDSCAALADARRRLGARKCDVVFVDGGHTLETARCDLAAFAALAAPDAVLLVDDVNPLCATDFPPGLCDGPLVLSGACSLCGFLSEHTAENRSGLSMLGPFFPSRARNLFITRGGSRIYRTATLPRLQKSRHARLIPHPRLHSLVFHPTQLAWREAVAAGSVLEDYCDEEDYCVGRFAARVTPANTEA